MMVVKRTKEELYGHDPELKRALDDLTRGKEGNDPMYLAPPADKPAPTFDADRFQQKTVPPGFLEFARTAQSPALKLEQERPKAEKAKPSASIAGMPVYSAPMAPPIANEPPLESSPVLLAGSVRIESDPRKADTLLRVRISAPPLAAELAPNADVVPSSLANRASARRLMRRILGGVLVLALAILGATVVLSPSALRSKDQAPTGQAPVATPALRSTVNTSKASSPAATPDASSQPPAPMAPSSAVPQGPSLKQGPVSQANAGTHAASPVRSERRPRLELARPPLTVEPKPARSEPAISPDDMPIFDKKPMPNAKSATSQSPD
jgi:hypothetical protein